jgi:hypothetical protein
MIFGEQITKEWVLEKVSEEEIFKFYLGIFPEFGIGFKNPLRKDDDPDCFFYVAPNGMLKFNDIAQKWNWDCFNVVQHIYKCNFYQALKHISEDFDLIEKNNDKKAVTYLSLDKVSGNKEIKVKRRKWYDIDKEYWTQYHITKEALEFFNVAPLETAWLNNEIIYSFKRGDIGYVYHFNGYNYKLYFPNRKRDTSPYPRFYHNNGKIIQGYTQLPTHGENLIITKSLKDVICLYLFDIPAIAPMSENIYMNLGQINQLRNRFKNIYILFDNDYKGRKATIYYKNQFNLTPLLFPQDMKKDFSDNLKEFGYQSILDYVEEIKRIL